MRLSWERRQRDVAKSDFRDDPSWRRRGIGRPGTCVVRNGRMATITNHGRPVRYLRGWKLRPCRSNQPGRFLTGREPAAGARRGRPDVLPCPFRDGPSTPFIPAPLATATACPGRGERGASYLGASLRGRGPLSRPPARLPKPFRGRHPDLVPESVPYAGCDGNRPWRGKSRLRHRPGRGESHGRARWGRGRRTWDPPG